MQNELSHQENVELPGSLPPRSLVHKDKKKIKKEKVKKKKRQITDDENEKTEKSKKKKSRYPLVRFLALLFILIPLTFIYIYKYWDVNEQIQIPNKQQERYYEPINLDGKN